MKNQLALVAAVAALSSSSCAPRTGPSEGEEGSILFWRVSGDADRSIGDACSDNAELADSFAPLEFEENSYFTYRVDSGTKATAMSCDRLSSSSCEVFEPALVFEIDGNTLTGSPPDDETTFTNSTCVMTTTQLWTLEDGGEDGTITVQMSLSMSDDPDCAEVEATIVSQSPNGKGLDGCVVTHEIPLAFDGAR